MGNIKAKVKTFVKSKGFSNVISGLAIAVVYLLICSVNYAEMKFDFERLQKPSFWFEYVLTLGLGIIAMVLGIWNQKSKLKREPLITDLLSEMVVLKNYLVDNGLFEMFREYLKKLNKEKKLRIYTKRLKYKLAEVTTEHEKKKYADLLVTAEEDVENVKLKFEELNDNIIFHGIDSKRKDDEDGDTVRYNGREGLVGWALPTVIFSLFFQTIFLSMVFSGKETTIDTYIQIIAKIWIVTTNLIRGINYGEYSVNTVYYAVLENRKSKPMGFISSLGINVVIKNNENYKFKVVEQPSVVADLIAPSDVVKPQEVPQSEVPNEL